MPTRALYIPHGGGPLPLLGEPGHTQLVDYLQALGASLAPKRIILISAHWETPKVSVQAAPAPALLYDYSGFPSQAYDLHYPAEGSPAFAKRVADCLTEQGIDCRLDNDRGYDHGMFVPLMLMFPKAGIEVVQVSLLASLDAEQHLQLGKALSPMLSDDVLLIGSGFSFHNMQAGRSSNSSDLDVGNEAFEDWLLDTLSEEVDSLDAWQRLSQWQEAPSARYCHPREEHLLPLHVCYGAMQQPAAAIDSLRVMGTRVSCIRW